MRLSEAILLGQPLIAKPRGGQLSTCALGMAAAATGTACSYCAIENKWPWIVDARDFPCDCAFLGHRPSSTTQVIAHLFDQHVRGLHTAWTLEQLADYVRSIEPAEPSEGAISTSSGAEVDCRDARAMGAENASTGNRFSNSFAQQSEQSAAPDSPTLKPGEAVCGEGPNQVTERAELLKIKAEELETMPR